MHHIIRRAAIAFALLVLAIKSGWRWLPLTVPLFVVAVLVVRGTSRAWLAEERARSKERRDRMHGR